MGRLNKEIGGEFWDTNKLSEVCALDFEKNYVFMLSGRTALDFLIGDIKKEYNLFKAVYMPSYCCRFMIEPFIKNNVKVYFYGVSLNECGGFEYDVDFDVPCDAVYLMQYFGYADNKTDYIAKIFKNNGKIIIKDATHSMFAEDQNNLYADYIFGSYRKWTTFYSGGFAKKLSGDFLIEPPVFTNQEYINLRKRAVELKNEYINGNISDKNEFLKLFREAENYLELDYCGYLMDNDSIEMIKSLDIKYIKEKRLKNARILLSLFSENKIIKPIFSDLHDNDCPLFVPVIVNCGKRDALQNFLIRNNIYCPVHWEISDLHSLQNLSEKSRYIYDNILSVVCDQRYDEKDMIYIAGKIKEFEEVIK